MSRLSRPRRLPGIRWGVVVCGLALLAGPAVSLASAPLTAAPRSPAPPPASSQAVVTLLRGHAVRVAPRADARRIDSVAARRPLTRARTVLPVRDHGGRDDSWVRVRLPGRPNGRSGWISTNWTRIGSTPWQLRVSLSVRRVTAFKEGRAVRRFRAVIGKSSTPTPRGSFFVEEALALAAGDPGGPFALATSARSNVLQEFAGGPGQIALHGTRNIGGTPGSAVSHGCIRLSTRAISWLAGRIGAGVPVTIER